MQVNMPLGTHDFLMKFAGNSRVTKMFIDVDCYAKTIFCATSFLITSGKSPGNEVVFCDLRHFINCDISAWPYLYLSHSKQYSPKTEKGNAKHAILAGAIMILGKSSLFCSSPFTESSQLFLTSPGCRTAREGYTHNVVYTQSARTPPILHNAAFKIAFTIL